MSYHQKRFSLFFFIPIMFLSLIFTLLLTAHSQNIPGDFFPGGVYDLQIPSPANFLGITVGDRPLSYEEILRYFQELDRISEKTKLIEFGKTYEGRSLHYLIVSAEANIQKLEEIRSTLSLLADPRYFPSGSKPDDMIASTPAVAWMMYGIHGDELSGPDAAVQLAYQLVAGEDSVTQRIRHELVVCIHPMENPDGRQHFLAQLEQWKGRINSYDYQSIQHTGMWPSGRGNHYHFDLNRDWFSLVNPESQARVKEILSWHPQLIVDAHEMGPMDTHLFSPAREPINPHIPKELIEWSNTFARDQAKALDKFGWSYYTKEWLEDWYPGYGSSWPMLIGSVGILYEQAGVEGTSIKRRDGSILSYPEAVQHQFISSMANLNTAAKNRRTMLKEFYLLRQKSISVKGNLSRKTFYILPGDNHSRIQRLIHTLQLQGIEVERTLTNATVSNLHSYWHRSVISKTVPAGTFVVRSNQPLGALINSILEFDPRMKSEFLQEERLQLLKEKETKIYDVTAWSLPLAYALEIYWSQTDPPLKTEKVAFVFDKRIHHPVTPATFGYIFDYSDDSAVHTLVKLLENDYRVRSARKNFKIQGREFKKGSLLIRVNENRLELHSALQKIVDSTGTTIYSIQTALAESGPDLGGNEFILLEKPHLAILNGPEISTTNFSALRYLLDQEMQIRHSILLSSYITNFDLRKYNVFILPSCWGGAETYRRIFQKPDLEKLKNWVEAGGTLIALENAAAFLADSASHFLQTRLFHQSFKDIDLYRKFLKNVNQRQQVKIDSLEIWEGQRTTRDTTTIKALSREQIAWLQKQDELNRLFSPIGAILRIVLDEDHWVSYGIGKEIPALINSSHAYLAMDPVVVPARFSDASNLRLSGLLWPEARNRWANTAYLTVERIGKGQVILIAGDPFFRAYFHGSGRLLINCILLAPGMGTSPPVPW